MSLTFARRRQTEAKKREQHAKAGKKSEKIVNSSPKEQSESKRAVDAGPEQKGKGKKAQKDSARI